MRNVIIILFMTAICGRSFAQGDLSREAQAIVDEGKLMYRSEMASWYGTDIVLERIGDRKSGIGGYFSYTEGDSATCVFFSKTGEVKVLASVTFDTTYSVDHATVSMTARDFTFYEKQLYTIRQKALDEIRTDTLFEKYKNTDLNLIPIIRNGERKVYVLTGPKANNVIIFGNDYLITFDSKNELKTKRKIHHNIISSEFGKDAKVTEVGGMHSHLPATGAYITATDICTLMLYEKFAGMHSYYVISKDYVSIWDCDKNVLNTITKDAFERINKDQKKRHPKEK